MARVMFALGLGEAVWYGVSSIQAVMAPLCRRPRPPSPLPKNAVSAHLSESSISECVRLCDANMAYIYGM